jgi:hypothetical protein
MYKNTGSPQLCDRSLRVPKPTALRLIQNPQIHLGAAQINIRLTSSGQSFIAATGYCKTNCSDVESSAPLADSPIERPTHC